VFDGENGPVVYELEEFFRELENWSIGE